MQTRLQVKTKAEATTPEGTTKLSWGKRAFFDAFKPSLTLRPLYVRCYSRGCLGADREQGVECRSLARAYGAPDYWMLRAFGSGTLSVQA